MLVKIDKHIKNGDIYIKLNKESNKCGGIKYIKFVVVFVSV